MDTNGSSTLLFFDDWYLHRRENLVRHVGRPQLVTDQIVRVLTRSFHLKGSANGVRVSLMPIRITPLSGLRLLSVLVAPKDTLLCMFPPMVYPGSSLKTRGGTHLE